MGITGDNMIYEQPLNEHTRICLRLETLFKRIHTHMGSARSWESARALNSLLELLSVMERPDLKSKLVKAMALVNQFLLDLSNQSLPPDALDQLKLTKTLAQLQELLNILHTHQGRFGQALYENAFLKSTRCYLATPGGLCPFNAPDYYLWLEQSPEQRTQDLKLWLAPFNALQSIVELLLLVIRESNTALTVVADNGFYQQVLDTKRAGQMIRVMRLGQDRDQNALYPVFSVGRHRLAIHFYSAQFRDTGEPKKYKDTVKFDLVYNAL